jgi:hypothetical protein
MTSQTFDRKRIYLPGTFQGKFARRLALYWILYHVAMWHCLFLLDYITSQPMLATAGPPKSLSALYLSFARQNWTLVMWAIAIGPVVVWQFIQLSHRVAGPMVRLERTLLRMAEGETVRELKFREGDLASSLESAFNAYLASLEARKPSAARAADSPIGMGPNEPLIEVWRNVQGDSTVPAANGQNEVPSAAPSGRSTIATLNGVAESRDAEALDLLQQTLDEIATSVQPIHANA